MLTCICEEFDYRNEFFSARNVVARKNHHCCECGKAIEPGEKYEYAASKNEDGFFTAKTCLLCVQIGAEMFPCSYQPGKLWDKVHQEFCLWDGIEEGDDEFFCICPPRKPRES